jgi:sirohydrochlorin cobaltochelatase
MNETILLMGHGSADYDGAVEFVQLVEAVRATVPDRTVEAGFLEFAGPVLHSIQDAIDRCAARGDEQVLAVPVLLYYAGHAKYDMPAQIRTGRERHPHLDLRAAPPLGIQVPLLEITEQRIAELEAALPPASREETAVLLVGRGTSDPEANADLYKIGRLLWERRPAVGPVPPWPAASVAGCPAGMVECCFIAMTDPGVPAGIDRCVRLGARRVLVIPYFLNTGKLVKRIGEQALAARRRYPDVEIAVGEHMGTHPKVIQLLLERAKVVATEGDAAAALSERTCLYRCVARESHHQHSHGHDHDHTVEPAGPASPKARV